MNFQLREKNFHQSKGEIEKRFNDLTRTYYEKYEFKLYN